MDTYLRALVAGDCTTTQALTAASAGPADGDLCGKLNVTGFSIDVDPTTPGPAEVEYGVVLATDGGGGGTIQPGKTVWFFDLKKQDGEWRLVSSGSGP